MRNNFLWKKSLNMKNDKYQKAYKKQRHFNVNLTRQENKMFFSNTNTEDVHQNIFENSQICV